MPLHPEAQQLLAALEAAGLPPFEHMTVPQAREAAKGFIDLQGEPEDLPTQDRAIPGPAEEIPIRVYTPAGDGSKPVIMYFHGGGWVIGDLDVCDNPVRRIANRTGAVVAPSTPGSRPSTPTPQHSTTATPRRPGSRSMPPSWAVTPLGSRPAGTAPAGTLPPPSRSPPATGRGRPSPPSC
jgi:hypothetical protein